MNDQIIRQILQRLGKLEREAARLRIGEVTDVNPLDIALGGSDVSYEGVKAVGAVNDTDQIAALLAGNDMLVLGPVGDGGAIHYIGTTGEPAFTNAWVNFDAGTPGVSTGRFAGFYKHAGRVYLQGMIKTGTSSTACFVLPSGYRPVGTTEFVASAATASARLSIDTSGNVVPVNIGSSAVGTYCFLDNISFRAA